MLNMRKFSLIAALMIALAICNSGSSFAATYRAVPPNMIGLLLTPTGFDGTIYEPGKVDIGNEWWSGYGSVLLLIQRSGFAIKEQFLQNDPSNLNDHEDHRCIVGPKREPMTLDVRLLFALPDYKKAEGKEALLRMGLLGNPTPPRDTQQYGGDRVLILDASTVYFQQVQQQVRGKIRDVCMEYNSVEDVYKATEQNGKGGGFTDKIRMAVGTVLADNHSPLFLIGAVASNVKPDPKVVKARASAQAADVLVDAMTKIDNFIKDDKTGTRAYIYKMMTLEAMASKAGEKGGSNTLFMTDVSGGQGLAPIPLK
jgi:hypothetical protein